MDVIDCAESGETERLREMLTSGKEDVEKVNDFGQTALMRAALSGRKEAVRVLVTEFNANVRYTTGFEGCSFNALLCAAMGGNVDIVRFLVEEGKASVNAGEGEETALIAAVTEGHLGVVKYLVEEAGADIYIKGANGRTALDYCNYFKDRERIRRYLMQQHAKVTPILHTFPNH
eukprot:1216943-Amorphochlora_amoeboformis.AAC.1